MTYLVWTVTYDKTAAKPIVLFQDKLGQQSQLHLGEGLERRIATAIGQSEITLRLKHFQGRIAVPGEKIPADESCLLEATFEDPVGMVYGGTGRGNNQDAALLDAFLSALRQRQFLINPSDFRNRVITTNVP